MYFLHKLKEYGFQPKSILDVGANKAEWTVFVKPIFPDARFFLIDAIDYEELHDFEHLIAVVSDREKEVDFFQQGWTGDSYYQEDTGHYEYVSPTKRTTTTLDAIFPEDEKFELIKIDCQGAELDILEGAPRLLSQCEVISLEVPFFTQYNKGTENFAGHIAYSHCEELDLRQWRHLMAMAALDGEKNVSTETSESDRQAQESSRIGPRQI